MTGFVLKSSFFCADVKFLSFCMRHTVISGKLLVIAQSARMLVQLAANAGFRAVAVDCFADADTRLMAVETVQVSSLALRDVQFAIDAMRQKYGLIHVVYGSGFEKHTETLDYLEQHWTVLGNAAAKFRQFQDKPVFFSQLDRLSIQFPETVFAPPGEGNDWLLKPMRGEGGSEISRYRRDMHVEDGEFYWQRRLYGRAMSVLFLASRGRVNLLGFNRQWTTAFDDDRAFVFAGIISHAELPVDSQVQLSEWLAKLIGVYPLCGLSSLDFMLVDRECYLLEVNPRIPASAQLYGKSIFSLHIQACLGLLGDDVSTDPTAYQVLYAREQLVIPSEIKWPEWVVDRPIAGALIGKGEPICSIISAGKDASQVKDRLRRQRDFIETLFRTGF